MSKVKRSLFDLLDAITPTPKPRRHRPAREISIGPRQEDPPSSARDYAARTRLRRH